MIDRETEKKFLEAEKYRANREFEKAIDIFNEILEQFPKLPPALQKSSPEFPPYNLFFLLRSNRDTYRLT